MYRDNIKSTTKSGWRAPWTRLLHLAAGEGHVHICRALMAAGADWQERNAVHQDVAVLLTRSHGVKMVL